ncbi:MAG: hypothetical protein ABUK01_03550 [Leptospirales bacterium]
MKSGANYNQFSGEQRHSLQKLAQNLLVLADVQAKELEVRLIELEIDPPFFLYKPCSLLSRGVTPGKVEAIILNYIDTGNFKGYERAKRKCVTLFTKTFGLGHSVLTDEFNDYFGIDILKEPSEEQTKEDDDEDDDFNVPKFVNDIWDKEPMSDKTLALEEFLTSTPFDQWSGLVPQFARDYARQFIAALAGASGSAIAIVMRYLQEEPEISEEIAISLSEQEYTEETVIMAQEMVIMLIQQELDKSEAEVPA